MEEEDQHHWHQLGELNVLHHSLQRKERKLRRILRKTEQDELHVQQMEVEDQHHGHLMGELDVLRHIH
jgi:hypothetical protein